MSGMLMAICPRCRTEVNTGISVDNQTMHQLPLGLEVSVMCGNCREYQRMMVKDLFFAQAGPHCAAA